MFLSRKYFGLTLGLLLSTSLFVYACGGGGGSSSGGGNTSISNASQGSQAASSGTEGAEAGAGLSDIANSLGSIGVSALGKPSLKPVNPLTLKNQKYSKIVSMNNKVAQSSLMQKVAARTKAAKMKTAAAPENVDLSTELCTTGTAEGTMDLVGSNVTIVIDFVSCQDGETTMNGRFSMTGSFDETATGISADLDMTLGNGNTPLTIADIDGVLSALLTLGNDLTMTEDGSITFSLTGNGTVEFDDGSESFTFTLTNFKSAGTVSGLDDLTNTTFTDKLNGSIDVTDGANSFTVTFTNFDTVVTSTETGGQSILTISYSGKVKTNFTPDGCIEGTFTFTTQTPLQFIDGASCPTAGQVTVNGNVTIQVNNDTTIDVTVGGDTQQFTCDEFSSSCAVEIPEI